VSAVVRKRCVQSSAWRRVSAKTKGICGVADLETHELVCEPGPVDVFELEQGAVAGFEDGRGERPPAHVMRMPG
jgi:hypothetical protein